MFTWYDRVEGQKALGCSLLQSISMMTQAVLIGNSNCIVWQDWIGVNRLPFISLANRKQILFSYQRTIFLPFLVDENMNCLHFYPKPGLLCPCSRKQISKTRAEISLFPKCFHHKTNEPNKVQEAHRLCIKVLSKPQNTGVKIAETNRHPSSSFPFPFLLDWQIVLKRAPNFPIFTSAPRG